AGERASSLTRQLLAFSRKQMLKPTVIDLNALLEETKKLLRRVIREDIDIVTVFGPNLKTIKADQGQIEQIILNLAINARDAMPQGGALTIRTENALLDEDYCKVMPDARSGEFVRLSVEDTGIGMDKATLNKIFEPFFTTKKVGEGTGLGLSSVYGIVKQHEGWINHFSQPGYGTTFEIYLPALSLVESYTPTPPHSLAQFQGAGERILLIEDDEGVRFFTQMALRKNGYSVFEATNALDALSLFEREKGDFRLVLCDVVLPDINGVQLVEKLISQNPHMRILFCSGYCTDQKSQWAVIREKNFCFLKKPYNTYELLRAVKDAEKSPFPYAGSRL
ncbi:MAG: ATP-binding protein, partial [bacterium]